MLHSIIVYKAAEGWGFGGREDAVACPSPTALLITNRRVSPNGTKTAGNK